MAELDYAGIIQAGQGLVGDLQEQMLLQGQRKQQQQAQALKLQQAQQTQARQSMLQQDLAVAVESGDPRALGRLMAKYPEFADQIKPGWEALSADARRTNLTQTGIIYQRAMKGDTKGAASMLRQRYEADLAAGQADETTKEILDALDGGDPQAVKIAIGSLGMMIAADDPAKFGDVYGKLNPTDATTQVQKEYQWRVGQFGQAAADRWLAVQDTKLVPVQKGGAVFDAADLIAGRGGLDGGGGAGGGIVATPQQQAESERARAMFPNAPEFATDNPRGGDLSTGMGGVPAPALGANGMPATLTPQQYQAIVDVKGKAATDDWAARNGVTVENIARGGTAQQPVRVRSVQEARKLPSGAMFVTPDGRTMRKP